MKGGVLEYKCRRCGEVVQQSHVPDVNIAMACLIINEVTPREWGMQAKMTDIHDCKDGNLGISDLIGAEFDPKKED